LNLTLETSFFVTDLAAGYRRKKWLVFNSARVIEVNSVNALSLMLGKGRGPVNPSFSKLVFIISACGMLDCKSWSFLCLRGEEKIPPSTR
jgi:hypothetical protein